MIRELMNNILHLQLKRKLMKIKKLQKTVKEFDILVDLNLEKKKKRWYFSKLQKK